MTKKTQAERTSAKALSRFAAVAAVLLTLCLVFMMPVGAAGDVSVWDGTSVDTSWYNDGQNSFEISTAAQLAGLAKLVDEGTSFSGKTLTLTADINLGDQEWNPIGTMVVNGDHVPTWKPFAGTFDGNYKTISNMKITSNNGVSSSAGFMECLTGTVKNLTIKNVDITSQHYAGAVVGYINYVSAEKPACIENCQVIGGTITSIPHNSDQNSGYDDGDKVGGIVGHAKPYVKITGCTVQDLTLRAFRDMGGIAGYYENGVVTGNSISNVNIIVDTVTNSYGPKAPNGAAVIGRLGGNSLTINNNVVSETKVSIIRNNGFAEIIPTSGETYYEITNTDGLAYFRDTVNAGNSYSGKTILLSADIDLRNAEWIPIGTSTNPFKGSFDGNEQTISNLLINSPDGEKLGLFGVVAKSDDSSVEQFIKDVTIHNVQITGKQEIGALIGSSKSSGNEITLLNCKVTGLVQITGKAQQGGLLGITNIHDIQSCSVNADEDSFVAGKYQMKNLEGDNSGGLIGQVEYNYFGTTPPFTTDFSISDCSANINVAGSRKVGGLIGAFVDGEITRCSASGDVTIINVDNYEATYSVGSLIGEVHYCESNHVDGLPLLKATVTDSAAYGTINLETKSLDKVSAGFIGAVRCDGHSAGYQKYNDPNCIAVVAKDVTNSVWNAGDISESFPYYKTISIGDVKISAGTYSTDVSDYVSDGSVCIEKDGKYVVEAIKPSIAVTEKIGFDSVKVGYSQPAPQTVTITNDGNVPIELKQPTSTSYVIGDLSATVLAKDAKATFTIQPEENLAVGNYAETITVTTNVTGISKDIPVSFLVYQPSSGGSSTTKPEEPVEPETPVEPENPTEEPEAGEATVETEVTDGGEVLFEAPVEPETPGADTPSDEPAEPTVTGVVLPEGTDSEVAFIPVSEKPAPAGKETQTKKVFEINVPKYEKGKPATVKFTMTVAELAADGKTAADVALWHQDEETGEWTKLVTTFVIIDGVVYFEAITFDFSPFAIVYEDVSAPTEPETPEQPTESPAPILAVLAGLGAAVVLRRK